MRSNPAEQIEQLDYSDQDPLHPLGVEAIAAIQSEGIRQHVAERLSQLAVRDHVDTTGREYFSAKEHGEIEVGVTDATRAATASIATTLRTAHDTLLSQVSGSETEPSRESVWQAALEIQRQGIFEAKDRGDADALTHRLSTHLVTIELSAELEEESDSFRGFNSSDQELARSHSLEPLLQHGLAKELVTAARQNYGLVVVRPKEDWDFGSTETRYDHASVAHVVTACSNDIELGLRQELSLDPAEPALKDMPEATWQERLTKLGVREAVSAAIVAVHERQPQEQVDAIAQQAFSALNVHYTMERDLGDHSDRDAIENLAQVIPGLKTESDYEAMFRGVRIARQVTSGYRNNNGAYGRKDRLITELALDGQMDLAARMTTASLREFGDSDERYHVLDWAATSIASAQEIDTQPAVNALKEVVDHKRQLLHERSHLLADHLEATDDDDTLYKPNMQASLDKLLDRAQDPESAITLLETLLPRGVTEEGDVHSRISQMGRDLSGDDSIVLNALERASLLGVDSAELKKLSSFCAEVSRPRLHSDESLLGTLRLLSSPLVKDLLDSPFAKEAYRTISMYESAEAMAQHIEDVLVAPLPSGLLQRSSDTLRLKHDILAHGQEWAELTAPTGLENRVAIQALHKRLELRHPDTGAYLEQPSVAIGLLAKFELPTEIMEASLLRQRQFIGSVLQADTADKLPSPNKEARLRELMPNDDLRHLYIQLYLAKNEHPELSTEDLMTHLQAEASDNADLSWLTSPDLLPPNSTPFAVLKQMRQNNDYKQWQTDRNRWLNEYAGQNISTRSLGNAWQSRYAALEAGTADNPTAINAWARENAFGIYLSKLRGQVGGDAVPSNEVLSNHQAFIAELCRVYQPDTVLPALKRFIAAEDAGALSRSLMSPAETTVRVGEADFKVEILAKDDPRGMTIGVDTGCCMTLDGASRSCIWAGYEDENYGFLVVSKDGKIRAQSVMYINRTPETGDVLVFDNIEANGGTDLGQIQQVYQEASETFIRDGRFNRPLSAVHIGVGYTQADLLKDLEDGTVVPTPLEGTYTDAKTQKVLLTV